MGWQAGKGGRILIQPNGATVAVSITRTSGASTTVYSDQARTSSVAMPNTVSSPAIYWLDGDDSYTVSCKVSGIECAKAGTTVGAVVVYIGGGQSETVSVDIETAQGAAGVSGSYGYAVTASGDTTGVADDTAIAAILAAGNVALLAPGAYYTAGGLAAALAGTAGIVAQEPFTRITYAGPAGGIAIGTPPFSAQSAAYQGLLRNLEILYPNALLAPGSSGLYLGMPSCRLDCVRVRSSSNSDWNVASCTSTAGSNSITTTAASLDSHITTGKQIHHANIPRQFFVTSATTTSASAVVTTTGSGTGQFNAAGISGGNSTPSGTGKVTPGMRVWGANLAPGTRVLSVDSNTQITLDTPAVASGAISLFFAVIAVVGAIGGTSGAYTFTVVDPSDNTTPINALATGTGTAYFAFPWVPNSRGIYLDGCTNPSPVVGTALAAEGQFEDGIRVATDLFHLLGLDTGFGAFGVTVTQDSIGSSAGPPYNTRIMGLHSYHQAWTPLHLVQANHGEVDGVFDENAYGVQNPRVLIHPAPTGTGDWFLRAHALNAGSWPAATTPRLPIMNHGSGFGGTLVFDDYQSRQRTTWTNNNTATSGQPARYDNLPTQINITSSAAYSGTVDASYRWVNFTTGTIAQGPSNAIDVIVTGHVKASTPGTIVLAIQQTGSQPAQGNTNAGPGVANNTLNVAADYQSFALRTTYSGQNVTDWYGLICQAGTATGVAFADVVVEARAR